MADDHRAVYEAIITAQNQAIPTALATIIETQGSIPRHAGSKLLVYADGTTVGTIGGGLMESQVIAQAKIVIASGAPRTETYRLNDISAGDAGICGGSAKIFIEPIVMSPTLLIVGGGHVGKALAELSLWAGFQVILSDDRPEYCNPEYVAGLSRYIVCKPSELTQHIAITPQTYIAAVTRGLPVDEQLLPSLLQTPASYIGLIGSRRRWALTAKMLQEKYNISAEQLNRIHAPIGLELQAETPKEIAISILGEIIMERHGGTGLPMRWLGQPSELE